MWKLLGTRILILILIFASGCGMVCDKDKWAISFFSGAVVGEIDPKTGIGSWIRVGEYKASGIEILKEGDDYLVQFDQSESRTEFDKMKFFLETGIKIGAGL